MEISVASAVERALLLLSPPERLRSPGGERLSVRSHGANPSTGISCWPHATSKEVEIRSSGGSRIPRRVQEVCLGERPVFVLSSLSGALAGRGRTSSSAAHRATHRLGTDTRTQLPREGRGLTNWVLQRSVATAANSGRGSPRGVKGLMPCADWTLGCDVACSPF